MREKSIFFGSYFHLMSAEGTYIFKKMPISSTAMKLHGTQKSAKKTT